ncbi:thermonuclease family protein [Paenibacillus polymyxa]|uniref:thermonuclease family protein n=1 Tax=Paenibacillus polymyxa TaxID=1406 RepID=UPI00178568DA|nr:thermonuclease family protein [Paenibacillus polymyxa]QOH64626.1 nuclease precursor [Paenibacillus polymyxa]
MRSNGKGKIIGIIFAVIIVVAIIKYLGLLIIAGGLGYWGYKRYQNAKRENQKSKLAIVLFSLAGIFFLAFIGNLTNVKQQELANKAPTVPAKVEQTSAEPTTVKPEQTSNVVSTSVSKEETASEQPKHIPITLIAGTDGDTFKASIQGKEEKIRLLLVDTPESVKQGTPLQPFAKEASAFTLKQLKHGNLSLELDVSERDKYGRLLGYVWVGDKMLNEMLIEKGYARVAYINPPNVKYVDQFKEIQTTAQKSGIGIWSIENYAQEDGFNQKVAQKVTIEADSLKYDSNAKESKPKVATPKNEVVQSYSESRESSSNVYYKNCSAVRAAGADPIHEGEPGYSRKLDRDGDGVACER